MTQTALDENWYSQLQPLLDTTGETFITLMPSDEKLHRLRDEFTKSGYTTIADLYPDIPDTSVLTQCRAKFVALQQDIHANEHDATVRELYSERVTEQLLNIDMILAAIAGDKPEFQKTNQAIYGTPNDGIFAAACSWIRADAQRSHDHDISDDLRNEILRIIPETGSDPSILFPTDEVFQNVKQLHFRPDGYIERLFASTNIPEHTLIITAIADPIVRQVIKNVGSSYGLVDSPSGLWSVVHSQHIVTRPTTLSLSKESFMGIVSHEIGSHLLESINGAASPLKLLQLGLDRYECGNEGRAFMREQIMFRHIQDYVDQPNWTPTKASWEYRIAIHLIISLASGLHKRTYEFAELYHLLTVLFRFWTAKRGEAIDETVIHNGAWSMATRALKGTDGQGGAYLKDIVYLEGNIRCWQVAASHPELIFSGDSGKFDIANPRHVQALARIGALR